MSTMLFSFTRKTQAAIFIATFGSVTVVQGEELVTLDTITVEDRITASNGLMNKQEGTQARSVISREAIEQNNTQNNVYQAMDLLPGVNTYSFDATGLFGGTMRIRGFNSDQIGVSIDGVPINDAGNFAVFPAELVDMENLEEISVIQGTSDIDAPMVGAVGGSIAMTTTNPTDQPRFRFNQSYGSYNAFKTFLRADTGYLGNRFFKAFVSFSKAKADKWKGDGGADREHVDFKGVFNFSPGNSITGSVLYNRLFNNHLRTLTLEQVDTLGRRTDFGTVPPQHLPAENGTAQVETPPADSYYNLRLNPYKNFQVSLQGRFQLLSNLQLEIDPYYSYGYGTGGNQLRRLTESNAPNEFGGGLRDINNDGDTLDTIMIYSSGLTETQRPGVTARLRWQVANNNVLAGYWFEYSHHRRFQPAVHFDDNGNSVDPWLEKPAEYLLRQDGSPYQGRDFLTESYSQSFFAQDDITFFEDKLLLSVGLRYTEIKRDFYNIASENFAADYNVQETYGRILPNVGVSYQFTKQHQAFFGRSENFRAPPDSIYYGLIQGGSVNDQGLLTDFTLKSVNVVAETSTNWELGYRFNASNFSFSGTLFLIDYRNRIASSYDPNNDIYTNYNVGDSITKGVELESAWRFFANWSLYGSFSFTDSRIEQNLQTGADSFESTAGKAFPDTPNWLVGLALQYRNGPWSANLSTKYTGDRYTTLVNDELIKGYTLVNFDAGYRFPTIGWFKNPAIRLNVYNLLNQKYLNLNAGSGSGFTTRAQGEGGRSPSYYVGAPISFSVMLSSDF